MACRVADLTAKRWPSQLGRRITSVSELSRYLRLSDEEAAGIEAAGSRFRWAVTPFVASLMDRDDPTCPIRRQFIPSIAELAGSTGEGDPLHEDRHSPVRGLVHKYPDRVIIMVTAQCASFCRHCTRRRLVGHVDRAMTLRQFLDCIDYIRQHEEIRDVLLTGGDPLVGGDAWLENLLRLVRSVPHVEIIRIGTRVPVVLPQRVTRELCEILERYHPLFVNIHFNHPREVTPEATRACDLLSRAGIPLGSQTVLLRGINDKAETLRDLFHGLARIRVKPYYLYQCDTVQGTSHLWTPVEQGLELVSSLRGWTSGFCVPTYVVDSPLGKIPLAPQNMLAREGDNVVLRGYSGETCRVFNQAAVTGPRFSRTPAPHAGRSHISRRASKG